MAQSPADRPSPDSYQGIRQRLERLPRGHPSCPYNADGSRKPPPPNLRALELRPGDESGANDRARTSNDQREAKPERLALLTEPQRAGYIIQTQGRLDGARRHDLATDRQFQDQRTGVWAKDRRRIHDALVDMLYEQAADVPCERKAVMAGGLGGAGKSTVLENHAGIDKSSYLTINPDVIKEEMAKRGLVPQVDGLTPMEATDLVHEESSHVAKLLAGRALADGKNVVWDITMSSRPSVEQRLDDLDSAGYETKGIFVDIPVEVSVQRAEGRFWHGHEDYRNGVGQGGRYVPPEVIRKQADPEWGSVNRRVFEETKHRFSEWAIYDNSVYGREPVLVASSGAPDSPERRRDA